MHASSDQRDSFRCDYTRCGRSSEPFTRKDHYRDHLRDYHKEDLGCAKAQKKRGGREWAAEQTAWLAERKVSPRWWRCARCLVRRQVQEDGWDCPNCKVSCEQDRIDTRMSQLQRQRAAVLNPTDVGSEVGYQATSSTTAITSTATDTSAFYSCGTCQESSGWRDNGMGAWEACPDCTPKQADAPYPADDYYNN